VFSDTAESKENLPTLPECTFVRGVGVDRKVGEACLRNGPKRGEGEVFKTTEQNKKQKTKGYLPTNCGLI
jgi:hypothetical protein